MLKLWNQRCLSGNILRRPGFIGARFPTNAQVNIADEKSTPLRGKIRELEEKLGIPWKSTCLPWSHDFSLKLDSDNELRWELQRFWSSVRPEYPDDVNKLVDSSLSMSSLLGNGYLVRNNGDRIELNADTFKGKFVFVCCFHAPVLDNHQYLVNLCNELCSTRDDVEVVMAAWMNTSLVDSDDHKQVFDHFFSAFPKSCLAVPFEDSKQRATVCKLVADYAPRFDVQCLVFNTQGMVLPPINRSAIIEYGAAAFPFTQEVLKNIKARDLQLKKACSLEQLLRTNNFSLDGVYKFNPEGGPREEMSMAELNHKLVGLYLPGRTGNLFPTLLDVYDQCMKKQLELEILVVYSDGYRFHLSQKLYQEKIDKLFLQKHDICRHWWCLPLNNSLSLQLTRLLQQYKGHVDGDRMCMVGPSGGFIDMNAPGVVMEKHGVDGYPFTREAVIQKEVWKMREITLESIFLGDHIFRGTDPNDIVSAEKLSGKKISVCFGSFHYFRGWECEYELSSYREMKAKDPGFEVVFVCKKRGRGDDNINTMPWYVCHFNSDQLKSVQERLGFGVNDGKSIVGFGEDGRVCSCRLGTSFTLDDTLHENVSKRHSDLPL